MPIQTTTPPDPRREKAVRATPIAFVRAIVAALIGRNIAPDALLEMAQITPEQFEDTSGVVTANQFQALSESAMRQLDDEALGWFERRLPWGSYGLLARAAITSPNLGMAMRRWCQHHHLLTAAVSLDLCTSPATPSQPNRVILQMSSRGIDDSVVEFCTVSVLRNLLGLSSWLIDSRIALQQVEFAFPRPRHASAYAVLFPCPVRFDAPTTQLAFDASYLSLPIRRDAQALQGMLQRALPLTVRHYRRDRRVVEQVKQFLALDENIHATAPHVAARLHVSTRSLFRQLKEEGESWQRLKRSAAMSRATRMLLGSLLPIKRVAAASGFQNEKSFSRAFKEWTGLSPQQYRTSHRHTLEGAA